MLADAVRVLIVDDEIRAALIDLIRGYIPEYENRADEWREIWKEFKPVARQIESRVFVTENHWNPDKVSTAMIEYDFRLIGFFNESHSLVSIEAYAVPRLNSGYAAPMIDNRFGALIFHRSKHAEDYTDAIRLTRNYAAQARRAFNIWGWGDRLNC